MASSAYLSRRHDNVRDIAGLVQIRLRIDTEFTATFEDVPYTKGTLEAACVPKTMHYDARAAALSLPRAQLRTAGNPHHVELMADRLKIRADPNDLSYVTAIVADSNGERVPYAENEITFEIVNGEKIASIAAVANGNPFDRSSFHANRRNAWRGRALAIIQPASDGSCGEVTLQAKISGSLSSESSSLRLSVVC